MQQIQIGQFIEKIRGLTQVPESQYLGQQPGMWDTNMVYVNKKGEGVVLEELPFLGQPTYWLINDETTTTEIQ